MSDELRDELRIGPPGRDDDLTRELRALYEAPAEPGYWRALEARIMARVEREGEAWWVPFRGWVRPGLVAAGVAAALLGTLLAREREFETRVAFQTIVETPRTLPAQLATDATALPAREATLQYVIAP